MAKSSKVEDYWRQHNIENLFKELTQILVRRMPPDPIIAIVEHLQKKFPKSFKTLTDTNGSFSKTLPVQSIISPHSDLQNEAISDVQMERRLSNQSQISGIATIPTIGSAFTDLLKQDTNSTRQAPELNLKSLVFANRLGQQAVRMRKDIRSDRDILEEEVIKPTKIKSTTNISFNSAIDDLQNTQRYDEPSVQHLIQYKQQIRIENDRRLHREKLAELARNQRKNEQYFQSDFSLKPEENQQQKLDNNIKLSHKPIVKSKEEEEILNDENVFQHKQYRYKERQRNKLPTSHIHGRYITDFPSSMKKSDQNLICKVCGNVINEKDNQPIVYSQQNSAAPTARSYQPQPSSQSVETTTGAVDDWFESALNVSGLRQSTPRSPGDAISPPIGSSTFRRSLFQPINNNNNNDIVEHRPPIRPLIPTDDDGTKTKRTITPRISESGIFTRSPESKIRRPSSSRSTPSPVIKKHQTDIPAVTASSIKERKMSGWSVREHSPDDSD